MQSKPNSLLLLLAGAGGLLMFAAQVPKDEAISNLATYVPSSLRDEIPTWLASPDADNWGMIIGLLLILISLAAFFLNKKDEAQSKNEQNKSTQKIKNALTTDAMDGLLSVDESGKELKICNDCGLTLHNRDSFKSTEIARVKDFPGIIFIFSGDKLLYQPIKINNRELLEKYIDSYGDNMWMNEFLITNNGKQDIYNLRLAAHVTYQEDVKAEGGGKKNGETIKEHDVNFDIKNILKPNDSYTIWFMNRSNYHVGVLCSDIISGELRGSGKVAIPYLLHPRARKNGNYVNLFPRSW